MKKITHYQKVMWGLYCEYSHIKKKKWSTSYNRYDEESNFLKTVTNHYERRSNEQWDFINSKFYSITKIDPIYDGTKKEFADYLEPNVTYWGALRHKKSPYDEKKRNTASPLRRYWHWYGCMQRRNPQYSKWQKRPKHVKKKILSEVEQAKRDWREHKGVHKDKAKAYPYWAARKASRVKPAIKAHRRFVKQKLAKGDYDIEVDYRFSFSDPWDWR